MKIKLTHSQKVRAVAVTVGWFFVALSVELLRIATMGLDPANGFCIGAAEHFHEPVGTVVMIMCCIWILPALLFQRNLIGLGTVLMFCLGFAVDFWDFALHSIFSADTFLTLEGSIVLRFLLSIFGILALGFTASFYMSADMGLAPYDGLPFVIARLAKIQFKWARMAVDSTHLVLAVLVTFPDGTTLRYVGLATVMLAASLGPIFAFVMENITRPFISSLAKG